MWNTNTTKANLPAAAGSVSSTARRFASVAHEGHIHHHRGIVKEVESVIRGTCRDCVTCFTQPRSLAQVATVFTPRRRAHVGFSDKLKLKKHDKPPHWEYEAEHRECVGTIGELQELDTVAG